MEYENEFILELVFKDGSTIKLENIKSEEIFQRIKDSKPDFPHPEDLINQYIVLMKQQKLNEPMQRLVIDMKYKVKNWYRLISTRIK